MNSGVALATSSVSQRLDLLSRSIRFLSCGKLKRASQLIAEAANAASGDSDDIREILAACQRLGLIVQSRKFLSKADVLLMSGDYENAFKKYLLIGIAGLPRDISFQVLHNKAVCLARLNLFGEAIEHFQEALLRYPTDTHCLQNLAFALMMNHDYSAALQFFSDLIRMDEIKSEHLLHILYGAAECRQRLNMGEHSGDMADHTLQAIQQHQNQLYSHRTGYFSDENGDDESYNDYGLAELGEEVLQNVSHVKYMDASHPAVHSERHTTLRVHQTVTSRPAQPQFRRLRYQPEMKDPPRGTLSIDTSPEKPGWSEDEGAQSPQVSVRSKQKRDALRRAVGAYDRSVLVTSPVQQGQVRATFPTLTHRVRATDPSPGIVPSSAVPDHRGNDILKGGVAESPRDPERTGSRLSSSQSVSSAKPRLSKQTHRRHNTHVEFALPTLPIPPLQVEKINAKPDAIRVDISYSELPADRTNTENKMVSRLAPAHPLAAPEFVASPLPVPHWRPQERVSVTKASSAPARAPIVAELLTAAPSLTLAQQVKTTSVPPSSVSPPAVSKMCTSLPAMKESTSVSSAASASMLVSVTDSSLKASMATPSAQFTPAFAGKASLELEPKRAPPSAPVSAESWKLSDHGQLPPIVPSTAPLAQPAARMGQSFSVSAPAAAPEGPVMDVFTKLSDRKNHNCDALPLDCVMQQDKNSDSEYATVSCNFRGHETLLASATTSSNGSASSSGSLLSNHLPAAGLSPPVLSDLSSSAPPPSLKATVQASHKPRRPSRGSMPDLDFTSPPVRADLIAQQGISPLIQMERPIGKLLYEDYPATSSVFFGIDGTAHGEVVRPTVARPSQQSAKPSDRSCDSLFSGMLVSSTSATTCAVPAFQPWSTQTAASVPLMVNDGGESAVNGGSGDGGGSGSGSGSGSGGGSSVRGIYAPAFPQTNTRISSSQSITESGTKSRSSSATGISMISAISTDSGSAPSSSEHVSSSFRYNGPYARTQPSSSVASEQQQEMDRVFEGRRYVDNYTVTTADVMKLRAEFQRRFPSSSGPPTVSYPYAALRSPGPYPPDVDIRIREMYLTDAEFQSLFHTSKSNWLSLPEWRQRSMKKSLELF